MIYIADSNHTFANIMVNKLRGLHIGEIKHFDNGNELLSEIAKQIPSIIVLDYLLNIQMHNNESKKSILSILKQEYPGIPVIIISSSDALNKAEEIINSGATDYVIKNNDWFDNLQSTIFNLIEIKDLRMELKNINSRLKRRIFWVLVAGLFLCFAILTYIWVKQT